MYKNIHSNLKNKKIKDIKPSSSKKYNSKINRSRIINYLKKFNVWWHTLMIKLWNNKHSYNCWCKCKIWKHCIKQLWDRTRNVFNQDMVSIFTGQESPAKQQWNANTEEKKMYKDFNTQNRWLGLPAFQMSKFWKSNNVPNTIFSEKDIEHR